MSPADQLPRVFQANADRFYQRVVLATLGQLRSHGALVVGQANSMDEFLDRCAAQVDNYTANEAAKAFALPIDGMFQRQLARWAHASTGAASQSYDALLNDCAARSSIDLAATGMADDLNELHLVANVVRHGEGKSCEILKAVAPTLWDATALDYYDLAPGPVPESDNLRIRPDDLWRYVRAVSRFWGHADPLPMATPEPPY